MPKHMPHVAVFISGSGTGLQAFIDAGKSGILKAKIALVVSSRSDAFGLERARMAGIDTFVFKIKKYPTPEEAADDLRQRLRAREIDYIALAGYLKLLPGEVVRAYHNRIVNIHPALLPQYGGKGMYGHHVHEAVLANEDTETGCTVHLVNEKYDEGRILEQIRVPVIPGDTPDTLAHRVQEQEHKLYPRVLEKLIQGEYKLDD
jgi:phosphoribosylglycinamide formyltransferase 1